MDFDHDDSLTDDIHVIVHNANSRKRRGRKQTNIKQTKTKQKQGESRKIYWFYLEKRNMSKKNEKSEEWRIKREK